MHHVTVCVCLISSIARRRADGSSVRASLEGDDSAALMIPEENNETWPGIRKGRYWTAKRVERGEVALFLRVVDIRTRIRRLVGLRKVGGTNEDRESSTKNPKARERRGSAYSRERDGKRKEAVALDQRSSAGIGPWARPPARPGWTNRTPRCTRWEKLTWRNHAYVAGSGEAGWTLLGTEDPLLEREPTSSKRPYCSTLAPPSF